MFIFLDFLTEHNKNIPSGGAIVSNYKLDI
jgi:hypothetical protein